MVKFKELYLKLFNSFKEITKKYPVSLIFVSITTLFTSFLSDVDLIPSDTFFRILIFLLTQIVGAFFAENFFKEKKKLIFSYILITIVSGTFTYLLWQDFKYLLMEQLTYIYFGYISVLLILSVYKILLDSKLTFQEYLYRIGVNLFKVTLTYLILAIGITLICAVFILLFFGGENYEMIFRVNILIFGFYYVIAIIKSLSDVSVRSENDFISRLIKYVLLSLVIVAFIVIYLYILKIFLLSEIPSNVIFRILLALFVVAFPIWNMAEVFEDNKVVYKISKCLPYAFIPFIFLEAYSLGIRIMQYGITPMRYVAIAVLFIQTLALILTFVKDRKYLLHLPLAIAIIIFIIACILTPHRIARINQKNIILKNMPADFNSLDDETKAKVYSAYKYFKYEDKKEFLPQYVVLQNDDILSYREMNVKDKYETRYISMSSEPIVDITQYKALTKGYISQFEEDEKLIYGDLYYHTANDKNEKLLVDITDYIYNVIDEYENSNEKEDENILENNIIKIDETKIFYITNISISYRTGSREINFLDIDGYILLK